LSENIHIVCLDAPAPPDYGGAIDMYYKIISLAALGKKIILHYYNYNKSRQIEILKPFCIEINAYNRKSFIKSISIAQPYIVQSRINKSLINRLNQDNYPILLEGLHCTGIIPYINDTQRIVIRMHNEEAEYYLKLARAERNIFKRFYFRLESTLLKKYYKGLNKNLAFACLSHSDLVILKIQYGFNLVQFIPCFIPWQEIEIKEGLGNYCLYHGNMAVSENEAAAVWLINHVFSKINVPFVIAGKGISKRLFSLSQPNKNIQLINYPTIRELDKLILNAQINILPSMNNTGVKLKILHALYEGRFCITNDNGVKGSGIETGLYIANNDTEYIELITQLFKKEFGLEEKEKRKELLTLYNNELNARKLNELW
jgi:hypothetical protein